MNGAVARGDYIGLAWLFRDSISVERALRHCEAGPAKSPRCADLERIAALLLQPFPNPGLEILGHGACSYPAE